MKPDLIKAIVFWTIFFLPASAISGESYKFQRLFTVLQQPWYFNMPRGIATDRKGFVYVADTENHQIQKFSVAGQFVSKWGSKGRNNGQFNSPYSVAADDQGFVYVADTLNSRIQKFDSDGKFIAAWSNNNTDIFKPSGIAIDNSGFVYGVNGYNHLIYKFNSNGSFITRWGDQGKESNVLCGIAIDSVGDVYITDAENHRIRKFRFADTQWLLIKEWGNKGKGNGEFDSPSGIAVDKEFVYVVDGNNDRIQKFTLDGEFKNVWGGLGTEDGKFNLSSGIATDGKGFVYTTDWNNRRIQKFTTEGKFVAAWKSQGSGKGEFYFPQGIATDNNNFIYVADKNNYRIQKFKSDGTFIMQWGSKGSGNGQFNLPYGIFVDSNGFVYVADTMNNRIQKFDENGVFQLSLTGGKDSPLKEPSAIAGDSNGNIYVVDWENHQIQKFDSKGNFIKTWGKLGSDKIQFNRPFGIAIDSYDNVYVTDTKYNCRIQKFDAEGSFISQWGKCGSREGELSGFCGITIDKDNVIYVADQENNRIQKFDQKGNFITAFGEFGSNPGQFNRPQYLWVSSDGIVYVSDSENNRIQAFRKTDPNEKISKAIIVAGGGPFPGNHLWDSTRMVADFAYRSLNHQGFDKSEIYYLSYETGLDLDNNGKADDIAGIPTMNKIETAITWAEDSDMLIIYLTDHGQNNRFWLSDSETLSADKLNLWLSQYQKSDPDKRVIVIYDACMSGSFVPVLSPAENRIVITSTAADEDAYFISQGSLSFSDAFWSDIFNGNPVGKSFDSAQRAVAEFQNPMIGIGSGISGEVFIGNGTSYNREVPVIECTSTGNRITCTATAGGKDGIARVWAVIMPSDYNIGILSRPVVELPSFELMPDNNDEKKYTGIYENYHIRNIRIAVYAEDRNGNTSVPSLIYPSELNVSEDKAVIVAGAPYNLIEKNAKQADDALRFQRYTDKNIFNMKTPTTDNLRLILENCASADTHDVLVYLVGKGSPGSFRISNTESLSAATLNLWLNNLQKKISGKIIVVCDSDYSGSFIPLLKPPQGKERILISGTSDTSPAAVLPDIGNVFSYFFWNGIHSGVNVRDSFRYAADSIGFLSALGLSRLDDSGNGIGNEPSDGPLSLNTLIGLGIRIGSAFPGDIRGTISDSYGNPVAGAKIHTDGNVCATSLPNGKFLMPPHPAGTFLITVEAPGYQTATAEVSVTEWGITVRNIQLNPIHPSPPPDYDTGYISIPESYLYIGHVGDDLKPEISCAQYNGNRYRFALIHSPQPSDPLRWKMDIGSFVQIPDGPTACLAVGSDLGLNLIAEYRGDIYSFTLYYAGFPDDPLIWKMDTDTLKKQ